jgi:Uma2 family endonuclease
MPAAGTQWRWQRLEYDRLVELGVFRGAPVELVGGHLVVAEPQGAYHAGVLTAVDYALRAVVPPGFIVRVQSPISLDDESEPEPDLAVVPGRPGDHLSTHPARPVLVIEIAEASLGFDREHKGSLYARARIADYWIVNLVDRVVEVYRDPAPDASSPFAWAYRAVARLVARDTVAPLAFPDRAIPVAALLP